MVVICSGRSKYQVYPFLLEVSDGLVGCAGAYVEYQNKLIHETFMPQPVVKKVVEVCREAGAEIAGMTDDSFVISESAKAYLYDQFKDRGGDDSFINQVIGPAVITEHPEEVPGICKVLYYNANQSVEEIQKALEGSCDVTPSSFEKKEADFVTKDVNEDGVEYAMKKLGLI